MTTYNVLITGSLDSGKYTLLSKLSSQQPQVKTLKFRDAQYNEHVVDLAYQEVQLNESILCVYVMSDELVSEIQGSGFLSAVDAIILCLDARKDDAESDLSAQLKVLCKQSVIDRVSLRMRASPLASKNSSIIALADGYHIAEELIERVDSDCTDDVSETPESILDFHLEDIIHEDVLIA